VAGILLEAADPHARQLRGEKKTAIQAVSSKQSSSSSTGEQAARLKFFSVSCCDLKKPTLIGRHIAS
jgi:hypothetical protein